MALNFPASPNDGDTYENYVWNATVGAWQTIEDLSSIGDIGDVTITTPADGQALVYDSGTGDWVNETPASTISSLTDTSLSSPASGDVVVYDGSNWVNHNTYTYKETVRFTSSGTFVKANYPNARLFVARVLGGGGGGGGWPAAGAPRASASGGGGAYVIRAYEPSDLSASETVTIGSGGSGSTGNGSSGSPSEFGALIANGGGGGYDWGGTGEGFPVKFNAVGGGSNGSSDFDYCFRGENGAGYYQWGTSNCSRDTVIGPAGQGGWYRTGGIRPFFYDFSSAIATANGLQRTVYSQHEGYMNYANSGNSASGMTPRTTNTGNGGAGRGIGCTGTQTGYGGGGDNGLVEVDIYV